MRAHRVRVHATPDQPLLVPLPPGVPEVDVEVIVLIPDESETSSKFATLREFNAWLERQPASGRSKREIDAELAAERSAWD